MSAEVRVDFLRREIKSYGPQKRKINTLKL